MSSSLQPVRLPASISNYSIDEPKVFEGEQQRGAKSCEGSATFINCNYSKGLSCSGNIEAQGCSELESLETPKGTITAEVCTISRFVRAQESVILTNTTVNGYVMSDCGSIVWDNKDIDEATTRVQSSVIEGFSTVSVSHINAYQVRSLHEKVSLEKCNVDEVISNGSANIVSSIVKKLVIKVYTAECDITLPKSTVDEVVISYERKPAPQAHGLNFHVGSLYAKQGINFASSNAAPVSVKIDGLCSTDGGFTLSHGFMNSAPIQIESEVKVKVKIIGGEVKTVSCKNCSASYTHEKEV